MLMWLLEKSFLKNSIFFKGIQINNRSNDILLHFSSRQIHLGNPKLPIYLDLRLSSFKNIVNGGYQNNPLKLRNSEKIRKLFAEIICVLCLSKKKNRFDNIKIDKDDFNITKITYKLTADTINYAHTILISALNSKNVNKIYTLIDEINDSLNKKVNTNKLNKYLKSLIDKSTAPVNRGRRLKFYYATQTNSDTPSFVLFSNFAKSQQFLQ